MAPKKEMTSGCPPGKEISSKSGRCVKKCKTGYTRDSSTGRCVVAKKIKASRSPSSRSPSSRSPSRKICKPGYTINPSTGRCIMDPKFKKQLQFIKKFYDDDSILTESRETRYEKRSYRTSGASEIIFMYPLSLNSRATGPKIRVPLGSSEAFKSTTALSSKRI